MVMFLAPSFVLADGGMIHFDPYSDRWDFADETNQQAFINYEKGTEKMILSVGVGDLNAGKTMWIFPVPADPNKVAVDVVTKLPSLRGEEISEKAQSNLDDAKSWLQATQIYTIPFAFTRSSMLSGSSNGGYGAPLSTGLGGGFKDALRPDVVVFEHLEKEGITSEIVTARTVQGFNEYFFKKGLKIDSNSIPVLQNYIGKEYSFVVSWMEGSSKTTESSKENISREFLRQKAQTPEGLIDLLTPFELDDFAMQNRCLFYDDMPCPALKGDGSIDYSHGYTRQEMNDFKAKFVNSPNNIKDYQKKHPNNPKGFFLQSPNARENIVAYFSKKTDIVNKEIERKITNEKSIERSTNKGNQKGVFVSFPTDKIFFPLMPTSVYGSKIVPADIRIMGHVTPDVFADIKSYTKTKYYYDESIQLDKDLKAFYNGPSTGVKYTKIEINAPSKFFTDDLWVKNSAPVKTFYQSFVATQNAFDIIFVIALCSVLSGLLAGWLLFKEWRNWDGTKKFSMVGLANCLTILGTIAAVLALKTVKESEDTSSLANAIKEKGYFWRRRLALGLIIADLPFLLISVLAIPIAITQLFDNRTPPFGYHKDSGSLWSVGLAFLPVIVLTVAWFLSRVKEEDQLLFSDLKAKNYSAWTFQPKDRRKIWFIILYSISFLIISWAIVRLFIFSVGGN